MSNLFAAKGQDTSEQTKAAALATQKANEEAGRAQQQGQRGAGSARGSKRQLFQGGLGGLLKNVLGG